MMPMKVGKQPTSLRDKLKPGVVVYSTVTEIYYRVEKGILLKYPTYPGSAGGWMESSYGGPKKACMRVATPGEISRIL